MPRGPKRPTRRGGGTFSSPGNASSRGARASSFATVELRVDGHLKLLPYAEVLLAGAEEDDVLHAVLGGDARRVFGGAHHVGGDGQVVREDEPGPVGGEVDGAD